MGLPKNSDIYACTLPCDVLGSIPLWNLIHLT